MALARISADISVLLDNAPSLVLDSDVSAGSGTITVKSILGVAINKILLFREPGNERAEIVATHAVTAPSGNTVTLAANLVEGHPAGTKVYIIPANQVRFYHSSSEVDANADDSSLSALAAAQAIDPTEVRNVYGDTAQTSGYYYWRFIDSINSNNLTYSDAIPWSRFEIEYEDDEAGYLAEYVRGKLGHEWNERFSLNDAYEEMTNCLDEMGGKLSRWAVDKEENTVLGQTARGVYSFAAPTDLYDKFSDRSVLNIRLQGKEEALTYVDEKEFDAIMDDAIVTQVRTEASATDTTLEIDNSYSFADDGTVHIYSSNTDDAITYTGVTRSATAGVLTGVPASGDGAIGATHAVDVNVWQNPEEGRPIWWTIRDGYIYIWPLPNSTYINLNILIDYYKQATRIDSGADKLDKLRRLPVLNYLFWKAWTYWSNNGELDTANGYYLAYRSGLSDAIRTTKSGQKFKMRPKINTIDYNSRRRGNFSET